MCRCKEMSVRDGNDQECGGKWSESERECSPERAHGDDSSRLPGKFLSPLPHPPFPRSPLPSSPSSFFLFPLSCVTCPLSSTSSLKSCSPSLSFFLSIPLLPSTSSMTAFFSAGGWHGFGEQFWGTGHSALKHRTQITDMLSSFAPVACLL